MIMQKMVTKILLTVALWAPVLLTAQAADFSGVPGVVINHLEPPSPTEKLLNINEHYVTDPSIVVMPNGDYIASHSEFDSGTTVTVSGKTWVFKSTDKGVTWNEVEILNDMHRGSLFTLGSDLYMSGFKAAPGQIVVRKSTDGGDTWTTATNSNNGVITTSKHGGSPNSPVVYGGKIWSAIGPRLLFADVNSNLLKASSWSLSNVPSQDPNDDWLDGEFTFWSEAQVVASPETGVLVMPKTGNLPYSALLRANPSTGHLTFDPANDFVSLPGAEKKFGATYDAVGGKFYAVTSIVLPAHADGSVTAALTRNTAAILSSDDAKHWDVEKIFLYSENHDTPGFGEGFQYFNFDFDGDDMAIVSRTAYDTTGNGTIYYPPRGHDTNLLTFHHIEDFRTTTPDQQLVVDTVNHRVLRQELNGNDDIAPLGDFTLGAAFAGAALNSPIDLAQDGSNGFVYVKEQAGRILQFDAGGNFLSVVASSPVPFQGSQISITQPSKSERSWTASSAADWHEPTNWYYWGRPDTSSEVANFGSAAVLASVVSLDEAFTIKGLRFLSETEYTISGSGNLTLDADLGNGVIDVRMGDHEVEVAIKLGGDVDANAEDGTNLRFRDLFDLNGKTMTLSGQGRLRVYGEFLMNDGTLVVDGTSIFTFASSVDATLDGTIQLLLGEGVTPSSGDVFDMLNGIGFLNTTFDDILLPDLADGLFWNMSTFYSNGEVSVALVSDFNLDGKVDQEDFLKWQSNFGQTGASRSDGDADGDGDVDGRDFLYWQRQFGAGSALPANAAATVPEPMSSSLVALGVLLVCPAVGRRNR